MSAKHWSNVTEFLVQALTESGAEESTVDLLRDTVTKNRAKLNKLVGLSKKKEKDTNAPTRLRSAYIFFCKDRRQSVKDANPDMKATEITAKLGQIWGTLTDRQKKPYQKQSDDDKKRYASEMETYVRPSDEELAKRKRKKKDGPKNPRSSYIFFCKENRDQVIADNANNPDFKPQDAMRILGKLWQELSPEQKRPYEEQFENDKVRYEQELVQYNEGTFVPQKPTETKQTKTVRKPRTKSVPPKTETKQAKRGRGRKAATKPAEPVESEQPEPAAPKPRARSTKAAPKFKKTPGFEAYCDENRSELQEANPGWKSRKLQSALKEMWLALDNEEREVYEEVGFEQD